MNLETLYSKYGQDALKNTVLLESIIVHRSVLTPLKNTDYKDFTLQDLNIISPSKFLDSYKSDYKEMQNSMIYGQSLDFEILLEKIMKELK
ncbi:hypothetical protein [uncultured Maribacter sp.]|uniref:hypothetical protein n=1 Tax=uncultured Maribacter sp. TaxID=431308 RepID=UPI00260B80F9|nr:hypothetical protein [uncultured Maribacter sp.]